MVEGENHLLMCSVDRPGLLKLLFLSMNSNCLFIVSFNLKYFIIMKSIALLGIYLMSFVIIYMMMSLLGLVFSDTGYVEILRSGNWGGIYSLLFGWWMSIFPAREYYLHNQEYLDRVF